jgi:pyridinium-3,5-bisthiocarboxylic acid mononucleotide nickel chelatase
VATLTGGAPPPAHFVAGRTGFGAGTRNPAERPNVLRLIEVAGDTAGSETLWVLQADIDDMAPEYSAAAQSALLEAGALDAVMVPVSMKKGRPGLRLEVLATPERVSAVERVLFMTTTTIGVRRWQVERTILAREITEREWRGQPIRWKRVTLPDGTSREKPEYEDVAQAAAALGMTPWELRTALDDRQPNRD